MKDIFNKHYITTNEQGRITHGWSDGPRPDLPTETAICINERGSYQFRLFPGEEENPALYTVDCVPLFQYKDGEIITRTAVEIEADRAPTPEQLAAEVRARREALLAATDWSKTLDAPIDAKSREAMRAYRQALRDIPEQAGFPADVVWPELPAVNKAAPDPVDVAFDLMTGGDTNA